MSIVFGLFDDVQKTGTFHLLTVCTGNICRSPLAALLLRHTLTGMDAVVASAGTQALIGQPMTAQNKIIASDLGVADVSSHRAQSITADHIHDADLVLALTRDHRKSISYLVPSAGRKTFTLREFARLIGALSTQVLSAATSPSLQAGDSTGGMRAAVEAVTQLRGSVPPQADPAADDVIDPYMQDDDVYRQSADEIIPAVNAVAGLLRVAGGSR